jgi:hypothetical protein
MEEDTGQDPALDDTGEDGQLEADPSDGVVDPPDLPDEEALPATEDGGLQGQAEATPPNDQATESQVESTQPQVPKENTGESSTGDADHTTIPAQDLDYKVVNDKNYVVSKIRAERSPKGVMDGSFITLVHSFGFETMRRNTLHRLGKSTLLTMAGNAAMLLNLDDLSQEFLVGIDGGGVGAITVHPSGEYFAIGEKGTNPNVYIYAYPSRELVRVLSHGTERAFSDMRFSNDGRMLATVGSFPDYLLHIWNWRQELIILRAKAFSQEVLTHALPFAGGAHSDWRTRPAPKIDLSILNSGPFSNHTVKALSATIKGYPKKA